MTQPAAKIEALKSLLPFLGSHLDRIDCAAHDTHYGDSAVDPGPPPPGWVTRDCDGECACCIYDPETAEGRDRCRGESWERAWAFMCRAYRMHEVRRAYLLLEEARPWMHRAVTAVYVEPYEGRTFDPDCLTSSEPISLQARIMRARVADDGLEWMAGEIHGELLPYGEKQESRANAVARLASYGYTQRRIAKELRCSLRDVNAVLVARESAVGV